MRQDEESRLFHHLYTSYAVLSVTDEALAAQPFLKDPDTAETALAGLLEQAADAGVPGFADRALRKQALPFHLA